MAEENGRRRVRHRVDMEEEASPAQKVEVKEEGSTVNPLLNHLIIDNVVKFLSSATDLKNCRLVNKAWNEPARKASINECGYIKFNAPHMRNRLLKFLWMLENYPDPSTFPYTKFGIDSYVLKGSNYDEKDLLRRFIWGTAAWITHLELEAYRHRFFPQTYPKAWKFPSLKHLHLTFGREKEADLQFMRHVVQHAPSLDSLSVTAALFIPNFQLLMRNAPCAQIKSFRFRGKLIDQDLVRFRELELRNLTNLDISIDNAVHWGGTPLPLTAAGLMGFLTAQSGTLQNLSLHFRFVESDFEFELPTLSQLKSLTLIVETENFWTAPLPFAKLPALKSVSVSERFGAEDKFFFGQAKTLKELTLIPEKKHFTIGADIQVAQQFPDLIELGVPATQEVMETLQRLWEAGNLQKLRRLTLFVKSVQDLDAALTGYNYQDCKLAKKMTPKMFQIIEENTKIPKVLHALTTLEIRPADYLELRLADWDMDLSCKLVIRKLRSLQCLNLREFSSRGTLRVQRALMEELRGKMLVLWDPEKGQDYAEYLDDSDDLTVTVDSD